MLRCVAILVATNHYCVASVSHSGASRMHSRTWASSRRIGTISLHNRLMQTVLLWIFKCDSPPIHLCHAPFFRVVQSVALLIMALMPNELGWWLPAAMDNAILATEQFCYHMKWAIQLPEAMSEAQWHDWSSMTLFNITRDFAICNARSSIRICAAWLFQASAVLQCFRPEPAPLFEYTSQWCSRKRHSESGKGKNVKKIDSVKFSKLIS
jgi:hypothetical protein